MNPRLDPGHTIDQSVMGPSPGSTFAMGARITLCPTTSGMEIRAATDCFKTTTLNKGDVL
jgi:hypothetical protein